MFLLLLQHMKPFASLVQMRSQGDARQSPAPQQGPPSGNYGQYPQQLPPQQAPPNSFQQGAYADPQRQQADPRTGDPQPPPRQQRPPAPVGWAEDSQSREMPLDGAQGNAGYGQVPSGRRHVEPFSPPSQNMGNDRSEFGMGRRGVGEFGRGGGQNASRGQTPPSTSATTGTGAASVMALGQNKLPQRAEVSANYAIRSVTSSSMDRPKSMRHSGFLSTAYGARMRVWHKQKKSQPCSCDSAAVCQLSRVLLSLKPILDWHSIAHTENSSQRCYAHLLPSNSQQEPSL